MQTRTVLRSVRCSERRPQSRSACRLRRRLARRVARRTTAPGLSPSTSTAPPGDFVIGLPVQKGYRTGTSVPVQRQRGEPGHTRDRLKNLTNHLKTNPTHRLTRQTTHPNPGRTRRHTRHTTPLTRSSANAPVMYCSVQIHAIVFKVEVALEAPRGNCRGAVCIYQVGELVVLSSQRANGDTSLEPLPPFTVRQRRAPQSQHGATPNPTVIRPFFTYYMYGNHDRGFVMCYLIKRGRATHMPCHYWRETEHAGARIVDAAEYAMCTPC